MIIYGSDYERTWQSVLIKWIITEIKKNIIKTGL